MSVLSLSFFSSAVAGVELVLSSVVARITNGFCVSTFSGAALVDEVWLAGEEMLEGLSEVVGLG